MCFSMSINLEFHVWYKSRVSRHLYHYIFWYVYGLEASGLSICVSVCLFSCITTRISPYMLISTSTLGLSICVSVWRAYCHICWYLHQLGALRHVYQNIYLYVYQLRVSRLVQVTCVTIYGDTRDLIYIYRLGALGVWICVNMCEYVWICVPVCRSTWSFTSRVSMCASACVLIWSFTSGTSHVYHDTCITIYAHVSVCLLPWGCLDVTCISDLYEHILCYEWPHTRHSCVRMSIALRLSWRLSTYISVCHVAHINESWMSWRVSTYISVCLSCRLRASRDLINERKPK